jgi:hypothetical protein
MDPDAILRGMAHAAPADTSGDDGLDRLERVERELAVRRLIDRYAHACDTDDAELAASLYAADGALVVRETSRSGGQILDYYRGRLALPTLHFTTGLTIAERDDGLLDVTCGFLALEVPGGSARAVVGRYHDVVRVVDGDARFVMRHIAVGAKLPIDSRSEPDVS